MPNRKNTRTFINADTRQARGEPTHHQQELMETVVAACAIIAHADGHADLSERRKLLAMMRRVPPLAGFSREDLDHEFAMHELAFATDPDEARDHAMKLVGMSPMHKTEVQMVMRACQEVLEADGILHPLEYAALHEIGSALKPQSVGNQAAHP